MFSNLYYIDSLPLMFLLNTLIYFLCFQVVLYKVGCLVGGAGLSYLLIYSNWTATFTTLACIYIFTSIWVCTLSFKMSFKSAVSASKVVEIREDLLSTKTLHSDLQIERIFCIFKEVLSSTETLWISLYVLLYKMGERGAINSLPLYLLDKGFPKESLTFWNGTVCQGLSVLGSIYGGVTLRKVHSNVRPIIISHSIYRSILIFIQCILIFLLDQHLLEDTISAVHYTSIASLCLLSFTSGVISTATFTFMMTKSRGCSQESQASHYSMIASFEVGGKLIFASMAGFGIDSFGMLWAFSLFAFLSILPILVIYVTPCHLYAGKKLE